MAGEGARRSGGATWVIAAVAVLCAGGAAAYLRWPAYTRTEPVAGPAAAPTVTAPSTGPTASAPAQTDKPPAPTTTASTSPAPSAPAQAEHHPPPPSFDLVRVTPEGSAVVAGRAEPGAEVTL